MELKSTATPRCLSFSRRWSAIMAVNLGETEDQYGSNGGGDSEWEETFWDRLGEAAGGLLLWLMFLTIAGGTMLVLFPFAIGLSAWLLAGVLGGSILYSIPRENEDAAKILLGVFVLFWMLFTVCVWSLQT
jgi:hypothetical protein